MTAIRFFSRCSVFAVVVAVLVAGVPAVAAARDVQPTEFRVLATSKTSTMEKEMNEAADAGFRFQAVMGGETAIGGKETVAIMSRQTGVAQRYQYRLLATNRTSTMQKEMQEAADAGFLYRGQTVFDTLFGGKEVIIILERDADAAQEGVWEYRLLATSKTSTMQKELQEAGDAGYDVIGMTVADTAMRGKELVSILRRKRS
jgi:hypothetical protein